MAQLNVGDRAPPFALLDQDDKTVKLSDLKGRKVLLYFYPKANTPGCTTQSIDVSQSLEKLKKNNIAPLGMSPDPPKNQKKFDCDHDLGFPLLADEDHKVAEAYGAWGLKKNYGKEYEGIIRSSFLIDEEGKILQCEYKVKPLETVPKALEAIG